MHASEHCWVPLPVFHSFRCKLSAIRRLREHTWPIVNWGQLTQNGLVAVTAGGFSWPQTCHLHAVCAQASWPAGSWCAHHFRVDTEGRAWYTAAHKSRPVSILQAAVGRASKDLFAWGSRSWPWAMHQTRIQAHDPMLCCTMLKLNGGWHSNHYLCARMFHRHCASCSSLAVCTYPMGLQPPLPTSPLPFPISSPGQVGGCWEGGVHIMSCPVPPARCPQSPVPPP